MNRDGSADHGIFQINDRYWCGEGFKGNGCNISCKDLRGNMSAMFKCVQTVYNTTERQTGNGFEAWTTYKDCKNCDAYKQYGKH